MLLFCDGFDSYSSTADLSTNKKWQNITNWTWSATAGRLGGGGLLLPAAIGNIQCPLATLASVGNGGILAYGFWMKVLSVPAAVSSLINFYNSSNALISGVGINTTGQLILRGTGTGIATTATGSTNVCDNTWHWIEVYHTFNNSVQQACYVDSAVQWNGTITLNLGAPDYFYFSTSSAMTINISWPIFYGSAAGAPVPTSFPYGPQNIVTLRPASDGTCTFGTVSAGTNHSAMVNNVAPDGDTTYVEGISGTGLQDLYNYGSISGAPIILAVMLNTMLDNPSGGTANFQTACKSSATTSLGTSTIAGTTYSKMDMRTIPTDPNTSAAWTAAGLNAAQFGVKAV